MNQATQQNYDIKLGMTVDWIEPLVNQGNLSSKYSTNLEEDKFYEQWYTTKYDLSEIHGKNNLLGKLYI